MTKRALSSRQMLLAASSTTRPCEAVCGVERRVGFMAVGFGIVAVYDENNTQA